MLKCEVKDSIVNIDMTIESKGEAYSEFFIATELLLHRLYCNGAYKKELLNLLKAISKDVSKGFPKFNEFCTEIHEDTEVKKEGE